MPKNSDDYPSHDVDVVKVAVAVVLRDGKVLVGKRSTDAALAGFDEFPGGKIEKHESPECAAVRECLEETGLSIEPDRQLQVVEHQYDHARVSVYFFLCTAVPAGSRLDAPQAPFRWVPVAALRECRFPPANDTVIQSLLEMTSETK